MMIANTSTTTTPAPVSAVNARPDAGDADAERDVQVTLKYRLRHELYHLGVALAKSACWKSIRVLAEASEGAVTARARRRFRRRPVCRR